MNDIESTRQPQPNRPVGPYNYPVGPSYYVGTTSVAVALVINPLVVGFLFDLSKNAITYLLLIDSILILIVYFAIKYEKTRRPAYRLAWSLLIVGFPPLLALAEVGLVQISRSLPQRPSGIEIHNVHKRDDQLAYALIPGTNGRHVSPGNFDVSYQIDEKGRKHIPISNSDLPSIRFFGDSLMFGLGVANEDTALNLIAATFTGKVNILNYAVMGYGLEQMLLRLESIAEEINESDTIVFAPQSMNLERNMIARRYVCVNFDRADEQSKFFPVHGKNGWHWISIEDECGLLTSLLLSSNLIAGRAFKYYYFGKIQNQLIKNADRIFSRADEIARSRGADFKLVFLANPSECEQQRYLFDLAQLQTPYLQLMPFCIERPETTDMWRFQSDGHWNADGHRWAAAAIAKVLSPL